MLRILLLGLALAFASTSSHAQTVELQTILQENEKAVARASRKTVSTVIDALIASKLPEAQTFLTNWQEKNVWQRKEDKLFFYVETDDKKTYRLIDVASGDTVGEAAKKELKQLKPNSGVRGVIAAALVQFQLLDDDVLVRQKALAAIERRAEESHLEALRGSIEEEPLPALRARKERLERLLTIRFDKDENARVEAIESFAGDLGVDVRAALNPILAVKLNAEKSVPETVNVANVLSVGSQISQEDAYSFLAERELAPMRISKEARDAVLIANIVDRKVADIPVTQLNTEKARRETYEKLAKASNGEILPFVSEEVIEKTLNSYTFFNVYNERSSAVTTAAKATLDGIESKLGFYQFLDLALDGLSLTSIYFLAAIGLAITFGVMGVINMAHGEFIMIGAYTGYVVQLFVPDYTISILVALPLAFIIAFAFGVAMERTVIRHLASRPLETLLATFGISIALQQIAKNIFGTQARPLTSPAWLDGAWALNDVVSISYIRIAIFILAIVFFLVLLFILNKTRLGLEVRAVTQNPRMAASMGINPDKINMLTFGLGSGIAGIAGVAIGLFAKVTSELGSAYIVQSFMTVVVGGVGNIWGTAAGATMIGSLQKGIEWFNPSNTLAAQTYMIIFIIIFIQFRPKGIIALKGRAAGD